MIFETPLLPIDNLSLFMLVVVAFLFPLIFIYSLSYIKRNLFRYYFVLFITLGGMLGTVLARDLLSFYIFLEVMTIGIYFLIIDNTKKESFPAGFKYILMMFAGGIFILVATLMLYNLTGTFEIAEIARVAHALPEAAVTLIFALFTIGCLVEIGAVPLHVWLPDAHPIAPSPISALLSGVVIKIGAYGIIRMILTLSPVEGQVLNPALILVGIVSMIFGVGLALKQTNVKRLLAYHSISQMGYVLLGIGVGTGIGIGGAIFHILNHATFKMLLFLCMGAVIYATGERELNKLGGLGKRMPITLATFGFAALAISGIPPFNGFASKALLSEGVSGSFLLKLVIILTAAGTFASFLKLFRFVFLGSLPAKLANIRRVPILMMLPMLILAGACLVMGLFPAQFLSNLIAPSINSLISFDFWDIKIFIDAFLIIFLGIGIYILGLKTGLLGIEKKAIAPSFTRYLSLDKICCDAANALERGCVGLRKLHARNLNAHLLWVFLALVSLLFMLR
jgi:multicomponent Na+:H+ antiporter subunit D